MFAGILLPNFRLQALLRYRPGLWAKPVAVVDSANALQTRSSAKKKGTDAALVVELTPAAALAGVQIGMTSPQALARCLNLQILSRAPEAEKAVSEALLSVACSGSAYVEQGMESVCVLDLQGLQAFRNEAALEARTSPACTLAAETAGKPDSPTTSPESQTAPWSSVQIDRIKQWGVTLLEQLAAIGLRAHIGIAQNPDLALLAAQSLTCHALVNRAQASSGKWNRGSLTTSSPAALDLRKSIRFVADSSEFLAELPLETLSPSAQTLTVLHSWGIALLGEFTRLRRSDIVARLGVEGGELWDRANGKTNRLLKLVRAPERYEEAFDFEHEIDTAQPLLFLLRRFVDQLSARLNVTGLVAAEMVLSLPLNNGTRYERTFKIPSPSSNPEILFRILDTHFEGLRLEFPPTGVRLSITPIKPEHQQFRLFENAMRDPNRFAETLARIMSLVGSGNVGIPDMKATHLPDQFTLRTPNFAGEPDGGFGNSGKKPLTQQRVGSRDEQPSSVIGERSPAGNESQVGLPLRRFRPPLDAKVHVDHERPSYIVSEKAHGSVVDVLGPYRLSGNWWEENAWTVEEWDVEMTDGGIYRLSKHGDGWKVEGCYDG